MKRALLTILAVLVAPAALGQPATSLDPETQKKVDAITGIPMTSALYYSVLQSLGVYPAPQPPAQPTTADAAPPIQPDYGTAGPYQVTNDAYQDSEPVTTTVSLNGTTYFTVAFHRYTGSGDATRGRIRTTRTTNQFAITQFGQPCLPSSQPCVPSTDYDNSFDSNLAANTGGGVAPGRVYLVGICQSAYLGGAIGVFVWNSNDAGQTWSTTPVRVDSLPDDYTQLLDNPHIAVNTNNGHVYVAYTKLVKGHSDQSSIYFSRSTDGGGSFSTTPLLISTGTIGGPQVVANTTNNNTYVVWADYTLNAIRVAKSTDDGASFPAGYLRSKAAHNALVGPNPVPPVDPVLRMSSIRAYTLPIARYNAAAHVVGVVWHEREPGNTGNPVITDAFYAYYDGTEWQTAAPIMLNSYLPGRDNFQPALDSDIHGNVWFVWYDTNYSSDGSRYLSAWSYNTYTGGFIQSISYAGYQSDPSQTLYSSIGDYQGIVSVPNGPYWGRFVHSCVFVPIPVKRGDVYLWDHYE